MMPSRAHFLLKRRIALSKLSFSPTLTVDIFFTSFLSQVIFIIHNRTDLSTKNRVRNASNCAFFVKCLPPSFSRHFVGELPAPEDMDMQMLNRLTTVPAFVGNEAEPVREPELVHHTGELFDTAS